MGLNPLTIDDLKFPEGRLPELLIYDWGSAGREYDVIALTRHGMDAQRYKSSSNRSVTQRSFRLSDLPLQVQVNCVGLTVRRGELYVTVALRLGGVRAYALMGGYLTPGRRLMWPPGGYEHMTEGPGLLRSVTGTDPAAGVEISEAVPTNARWLLHALRFTLITDATVATRQVSVLIDDGVTTIEQYFFSQGQAASLTRVYSMLHVHIAENVLGIQIRVGLSNPIPLFQGWRIRTSTDFLQAGDNFGAPQLFVEEWIEE